MGERIVPASKNYLYRQFFRLRIHESSGDGFQLLFSRIMAYCNPSFQAVSPWGNWGDGGNDGWIAADNHYFQVFGPKPGTQTKELEAVKKAIGDFDKLIAKWGSVLKYTFVMNDRFQGIPAPIGAALKGLKEAKSPLHVDSMGGMELLSRFMSLDDDIKQDIVGGIPDINVDFVDTRAVGELLGFLAGRTSSVITFLSETAPDFGKKISINQISNPIRARLEANSFQSHVIDEFLNASDTALQQAIAQEVKDVYTECKIAISENLDDFADLRYLWMVDKLIPPSIHEQPLAVAAYRNAAELVLAKYFETCDAYEHPNNVATS